ncbi:Tripeptidyl aminopeptidase [Streptomyces hundungensis]|uniref:Tripeptidyl aminopeptidase n=1 Tax=Streptomyces hundungensis TaxID=1077946 RepID=A0A387HRL6_9ACTN|nr:alpha/beta hydrolase [Streptomyces hundungensis]AYG84470.1 Tripeptidyl aminopeptidase [Streptomyces hundungensis]
MQLFRKPARWAAAVACGLLATAALPGTAASAATTATASVPDRYRLQHLDWQPCVSTTLECATMAVPRDWYHPSAGPGLSIQVSRHRATDPATKRGVLMMAAGGPGSSGYKRPANLARLSPKLAAAYDIVSFDQRGVGASTNVVCSDQATVDAFFSSGDLRDRSAPAIRATFDRARDFVADCERHSGGLLPYITSDQAVHDMDLYRALLGADKISYYGPSYATVLGAYYATEFPRRVERVVLDSTVDLTRGWEAFLVGQPLSFQRRFEGDFLPWLAKNDATYHQGRTPAEAKASYERLRAALRDHPLDLEGTRVTPNHLDAAATNAVYNAGRGFPHFAAMMGLLENPDGASEEARKDAVEDLQPVMSAPYFADFSAVTCGDTPWKRDRRYWVEKSAEATRTNPLAGARELTFAAVCANWPRSGAPRIEVTGKGLPPVLMLNSTMDPATYYEGALRVHRGLAGSRLVTVDDGDHGQFQTGNACADAHVENYLLDGVLPPKDTTCPGVPLPAPTTRG